MSNILDIFAKLFLVLKNIRKIDAFFIICEFFRLSQKQINFELSVDCVEVVINEKIKKPYTKRVSSRRGGKNYQFLFNKGCEDCKDKQGKLVLNCYEKDPGVSNFFLTFY